MLNAFRYISVWRRRLCAALFATVFAIGIAAPVTAQGLAQVSVAGIPPVLSSPVVSEIAAGFEQGRFPLTLVITTPDRQPIELTIRFLLERDGETVIDVESDPVIYERGVYVYTSLDQEPPVTFPVSYRDLVAVAEEALGQNVSRTGVLSEGMYTLTVEAESVDPSRLLLTVPSVSTFFVQYLEPPVLLTPSPDEVVSSNLPVFSWMPVLGGALTTSFEYQLLLVEVHAGQEPQQAIESNRPIALADVPVRTSLPYTQDRLPLIPGRTYAWQVSALDAEGRLPFTDDGKSEISTFVYAPMNAAIAAWTYPNSRPAISFNLAGAELRTDGYFVHGLIEGSAGAAPVGAYFDNVVIDPVSLALVDGSVDILGPLAENAGAIDSDARPVIVSDDTGPTTPSIVVRKSSSSDGTRLNVVVGPAEDPESGVSAVELRLSSIGGSTTAESATSLGGWQSLYSNDAAGPSGFGGASYRIDVAGEAADALALGWLEIEVRVTNGLGLTTVAVQDVSAPSDVSPPILSVADARYSGFYDALKPNTATVSNVRVVDGESGVAAVQYRVAGDSSGVWRAVAEPGADRFSLPELDIHLPDVERDSTIGIEVRAVNGAGLVTTWSGRVQVDIDESAPVLIGELGAFVESDVDPRIEITSTSVVDPESGVPALVYRVVDDTRPTTVLFDWTPFPSSGLAEVKRTQLNFAERRNVRLQVRAENGAGLTDTFSQRLSIPALAIADRTPPAAPSLSVGIVSDDGAGGIVLEVRIGESADRESGVNRVLYRIENPESGAALVAWRQVDGVSGGRFDGAIETASLRVPAGSTALRVVVRVSNGARASTTTDEVIRLASQDLTPPEIRGIQAYAQDDRLLIFVDGLADAQSFIDRVEYRVIGSDGSVLLDWTDYPIVPARRPSYGRQLLRADIPPGAQGREVVIQLRAFNGAGLSVSAEQRVALSGQR